MTRFQQTLATVVTTLALAAAPALAQQAGSRSAGDRPTVGTARPRTPSAPSSSASTPRPSAPSTAAAGSSRPASRPGSAASGDARGPGANPNQRPAARAVPQNSRPRENRPAIGTPQPRAGAQPLPARPGSGGYWGAPRSTGYGYPAWGWGWGWGYGFPYYGAFGRGFVHYYDPYWWGNSPYYGSYAWQDEYVETGKLRLRVKPREAQVFVDGYYVGIVDEFDGTFQRLRLEAGGHRVEIRLDGYSALIFDVLILPGKTTTYRGNLPRIP